MDERRHNVNAQAVSGRDNEHLLCYSSYITIFLTVAWLKPATNINIDMCLIMSRLVPKELYQRKSGSLVIIAMKWNLEWCNILENIVIALVKNTNLILLDALMSRTRRFYIYLGIRRSCNCVITAAVIQYIPRNMHTVFALLCFVVVIHWLIFPYPSGLLHWHCGNLTIAPVPAKQPWWIWINTSCEFIMNDCIATTKQSTTKPCAYVFGYTVRYKWSFRCTFCFLYIHN